MEYKVAMTESFSSSLREFLLRDTADEEVCFALWHPATGHRSLTALLCDLRLPLEGDRVRMGNVSALPHYVDRCKEAASEAGAGMAVIHTHPSGRGHQDVSPTDLHYEQDILAAEAFGVTGLPLVGMTLAGDGTWSARAYPMPFRMEWCSTIRTVGKFLRLDFHPALVPRPRPGPKTVRTASVWGEDRQSDIARLRIGVVGAGSVGSAVCEALARMGAGRILVMDYDRVEEHNLDRMEGASALDMGAPKIRVAARNMKMTATLGGFACESFDGSVVEREGMAMAMDCDVLFSCVDRPWPRHVLNHLAYGCLIPVVDGGAIVRLRQGKPIDVMYRAQTVGPERACLHCLGALDAGEIQQDRDGMFDDTSYIVEMERRTGVSTRQNVMPLVLGTASTELLQFAEMVTGIAGVGDMGQQPYDHMTGEMLPIRRACRAGCHSKKLVGQGDGKLPYMGTDRSRARVAAEAEAAEMAGDRAGLEAKARGGGRLLGYIVRVVGRMRGKGGAGGGNRRRK